MAPVGSGIDQHVVRLSLQSPLNDRLQIFVLYLKLFKRKIIHIDDKFVISILDLGDNVIEILELVLVYLDHPQPLVVIFI